MRQRRNFDQFEGEFEGKVKRRKRIYWDDKHKEGALEDDGREYTGEVVDDSPELEQLAPADSVEPLDDSESQVLLDQCRTDYARRLIQRLISMGISPDPKRFDQHFLTDEGIVYDMVGAADIKAGDSILEIGPGPGQLTEVLLEVCREERAQLTAIEIDRQFEAALVPLTAAGLQIYWGDAIKKFREITERRRINKIVANPPYRILEPLLAAIHTRREIERAVLLLGKTYADHAVASPSDPRRDFSVTSLYSQARFIPTIEASVPRESFIPEPRTESAVVVLTEAHQGVRKMAMSQLATARIQRPNVPVGKVLGDIKNGARSRRTFVDEAVGSSSLSSEILRRNIGSLSNSELQIVVRSLLSKH